MKFLIVIILVVQEINFLFHRNSGEWSLRGVVWHSSWSNFILNWPSSDTHGINPFPILSI